jgi:hypothetical protein
MTPQEQQMLQGLTDRINQTVLPDKDPEAEQFLTQSLGRNPDAIYILAQTVLVQQYALDQAKKQLDDTKQQLAQGQQQAQQASQPVHHTSFLGSLLGTDDRAEPSRTAPPPPPAQTQYQPVPNYAPPPPSYGQPQYVQPGYGAPVYGAPVYGAPMGGSGFLGSALRTAGGVAAGALAFEGIESLMHGFGEHAGYGSGFSGMGGGEPREEVINNYYGDSAGHEHEGVSRDIEDRRDDNSTDRNDFADTSNTDDSNDLDTSTDDSSSFDDSGSFDDGGGGSDDSNV